MYSNSYVLVGLVFLVNRYADSSDDRDYFQLILRELWSYPILKQTLIHLCRTEFDKCKRNQIFRTYLYNIHDRHLKTNLDYFIECFMEVRICRDDEHWQSWSQWTTCSVTCGKGRNNLMNIDRDSSECC